MEDKTKIKRTRRKKLPGEEFYLKPEDIGGFSVSRAAWLSLGAPVHKQVIDAAHSLVLNWLEDHDKSGQTELAVEVLAEAGLSVEAFVKEAKENKVKIPEPAE